ncbi:hypothetical protein M8818_000368 [Zalaria obscura]|uniref:Uncharacterized protein n=1 Tax=Zalaria obscura TaxID=2024903 RepID=A0ACC3SMP1_9PEZI
MLPPRVHHYAVRCIVAIPIAILLALLIANIGIICRKENQAILYARWLPKSAGTPEQVVGSHTWKASHSPSPQRETVDEHPVGQLMKGADQQWKQYDMERSKTFKATVETYRRKYGRHPPPGFKQWYKFARQRQVYHIDDFDQINDDLRPFWALKPNHIRKFAAHASDNLGHDLSTVSIRQGQVFQEVWGSWRTETFISLLAGFAQHLPDMDLAMNRMDQPRVIVPWDQLQSYLAEEFATRSLDPNVEDAFTANMDGLYRAGPKPSDVSWWDRWVLFPLLRLPPIPEPEPPEDWGWFAAQGQQFMNFAGNSCPPTSHGSNSSVSKAETERSYKSAVGGFISNFSSSSDLCTVGHEVHDKHGMLYASTSIDVIPLLVTSEKIYDPTNFDGTISSLAAGPPKL